jgi:hypothetical protein
MLDDIEAYIDESEAMIENTLKCAVESGDLSQELANHIYFSLEKPKDWNEAFSYYHKIYQTIINHIREKERNRLLERLVKGAKKIETETDPDKRYKYIQLYAAIENELNEMKGERT